MSRQKKIHQKITIYFIKDISLTRLANEYCELHRGKKRPLKSEFIREKMRILIHYIVSQTEYKEKTYNDDNDMYAELHSSALASFMGKGYKSILDFLQSKDVIKRIGGYTVGKSSFHYAVSDGHAVDIKQYKPSEWKRKYPIASQKMELVSLWLENQFKELPSNFSTAFENGDTEFITTYLDKLSLVELRNPKGMRQRIEDIGDDEIKRKNHAIHSMKHLEEKSNRWSYDARGRIYHRLTGASKWQREYLNLRCVLDLGNCQPLLLGDVLRRYFKISDELMAFFGTVAFRNCILREYPVSYQFSVEENRLVCTHHIAEGVSTDNRVHDLISQLDRALEKYNDLMLYLYTTAQGAFWQPFRGISDDYKKDLFKQVVYRKKKIDKEGKEYLPPISGAVGKLFLKIYPHVASAIRRIILSNELNWLPNEMTRIEQVCMRKILKQAWAADIDAVSIHDAIAIIDTHSCHGGLCVTVEGEVEAIYNEVLWEELKIRCVVKPEMHKNPSFLQEEDVAAFIVTSLPREGTTSQQEEHFPQKTNLLQECDISGEWMSATLPTKPICDNNFYKRVPNLVIDVDDTTD